MKRLVGALFAWFSTVFGSMGAAVMGYQELIRSRCVLGFGAWLWFTPLAFADTQFSIYGGIQQASPSVVSGKDSTGSPFNFTANWQGNSFTAPPYYGLRATHWLAAGDWGLALEFTHTKIYADDATLAASGFEILEFTDGLNILTINAMRRFDTVFGLRPYAGAGIGISVPHVEVQTTSAGPVTFEYQLAGPSARALAGVEYDIGGSWSVFGEVNATYSENDTTLTGGGNLSTDVFTQAVNFGASFRF